MLATHGLQLPARLSTTNFTTIVADNSENVNRSDENFSNDGKYYRLTISVGEGGSLSTVYNVGKIKESIPPSAKIIAVVGSRARSEMLSNNSIPHPEQKSNHSDEKIPENFSNDGKTGEVEAKKGEIEIPYSRKRATGAVKSNVDIKENTGYNVNETNFSKKGSTKSEKENDKDSGLLVHGRETSTLSGSKNNQRKQGNDSSMASGRVENVANIGNGNVEESGHQRKAVSWLERNRFISQASLSRFQETLLRNRSGLNSTDVNGKQGKSKNTIFRFKKMRMMKVLKQ